MTLLQINTVAHGVTPVAGIMRAIHAASLAAGIDAHMVAGYGDGEGCDLVMESRTGLCLNALSARLRGDDGFAARMSTRLLLRHIEHLRPDIVHLHNAHGYYLNLPILQEALRAADIPLVVTLHDHWWLTGRCATPQANDCSRYLTRDCARCPYPDVYPAALRSTKPHYKDTDGITFVAPSRGLAAHFGAGVIPNGVEIPRPAARTGVRPFALAVADRWTIGKDPLTLMELAPLFDMPLVIVGELPGSLLRRRRPPVIVLREHENLPQIINTLGPGNVVHIPGSLDKQALAQIYTDAAVLISTSRSEAFGMTVAEALLCGTPAVVRAGTAPAELLTDADGLATPFTDLRESADAIVRAAHTLHPTAALITTPSAMADAYMALYRRLC